MFSGGSTSSTAGSPLPVEPTLDGLRDALEVLATHDGAGLTEAQLVEHLTALEQLKSGIAAAQARVSATFASARAQAEADAGVPAAERCRGLGNEVGLARQESPVRGRQHLGLALVLVHEMPHTLTALTRGEISEWRATLVARETATLSRAHRSQVDRELVGSLAGAGDKKVADLARTIGYRLDPGSALRRVRGAEADRRVGLRPAPETMSNLSALLPVVQGVACYAALTKEADARRAAGDPRTRGQIMADTLVQRVTGQATATGTPVEVGVLMTDRTLLADDQVPARLEGFGPIPAFLARRLVRAAEQAWVRRLYTEPGSGSLVAMESRRRTFDGQLRQFLVVRDQTCRNRWCDAPIRHADHITRVADGGRTTADNGQALCEACNDAKESPGWSTRRVGGTAHEVETLTPTGHRHRSRAPAPPGERRYPYRLEIRFAA